MAQQLSPHEPACLRVLFVPELFLEIVVYLEIPNVCLLRAVSRKFYTLIESSKELQRYLFRLKDSTTQRVWLIDCEKKELKTALCGSEPSFESRRNACHAYTANPALVRREFERPDIFEQSRDQYVGFEFVDRVLDNPAPLDYRWEMFLTQPPVTYAHLNWQIISARGYRYDAFGQVENNEGITYGDVLRASRKKFRRRKPGVRHYRTVFDIPDGVDPSDEQRQAASSGAYDIRYAAE